MEKDRSFKDLSRRIIRWSYLRKAREVSVKELEQYTNVANVVFKQHYRRSAPYFKNIGYGEEDVKNLLKVHTVSFIGHISFINYPEKVEAFVKRFKQINNRLPTESDILKKSQSDCHYFLRQRMQESVEITEIFKNGQRVRPAQFNETELVQITDQVKTPEEILMLTEEERILIDLKEKFENLSKEEKESILSKFIEENTSNAAMSSLVNLAKSKVAKL